MIPTGERGLIEDWDWPQDVLSDVVPEERIGVPLPNRRRRGLRRLAGVALLVGAGTGLSFYSPDWIHEATTRAEALTAALMEAHGKAVAAAPPSPSAFHSDAMSPAQPPEIPGPSESAVVANAEDLPVRAVAEAPPIAATTYTPEAAPPEAPSGDPVARARAVKAGLGPDLPNVLLARLSKGDLENAAYAIKTALAKRGETAVLSWPPKPSAEQALFEVRFVPGAEEGCRRYVVTVTKERWSMTSGAVETCRRDERP